MERILANGFAATGGSRSYTVIIHFRAASPAVRE
jgi:hypothetical protein